MKALRQSTINISAGILMAVALPFLVFEAWTLRDALDRSQLASAREKYVHGLGDELRDASDFLTEACRAYLSAAGDEYQASFWNEVLVTRRRELVLAKLRAVGTPPAELALLDAAKRRSERLVGTESLAMRLAAEARGLGAAAMPAALAAIDPPPPLAALPREGKLDLARELVFGPAFLDEKRAIAGDIAAFFAASSARTAAASAKARREAQGAFLLLVGFSLVSLAWGAFLVILYYVAIAEPIRGYIAELAAPEPGEGIPSLRPRGTRELMALAAAFNERRAERLGFEAALRDSERRFRTHLRLMPLAAIDLDERGRVRSWNHAAERIFGYSEEEAAGRNVVELLVPPDIKPEVDALVERLNLGEIISTHVNRNLRKDGREIVCEWYNTPLFDSRGAWTGWASIVKDVTEQHEEAERVLFLASHDPLTGLMNRRALSERIEIERARCERTGGSYCLVMLDIDRFKAFNDRYGHECGDHVLKSVAREMRATLRATDSVGRWGGEEFLVLLVDTDLEGGRDLAEKIRAKVEASRFSYGKAEMSVTVTAGVSACAAGEGSAEARIRSADEALLRGKREGRNRVVVASRC